MQFLIFLFISVIEIAHCFYPYVTNFQLIIRNNNYNPAISFMNLNKILNSNEKKNDLNINYYNNNQSIIFNYKTYSYLEDYKYSYKYLLKNKNTFLIKYDFRIFDDLYKYLIYIKSSIISPTRIRWDICVRYNNLIINDKQANDKIIIKTIRSCISKNETNVHPILNNYFDLKNNVYNHN
jgi:hypothetical protein